LVHARLGKEFTNWSIHHDVGRILWDLISLLCRPVLGEKPGPITSFPLSSVVPSKPLNIPQLEEGLSPEKLTELLEKPDQFQEYFNSLDEVKKLIEQKNTQLRKQEEEEAKNQAIQAEIEKLQADRMELAEKREKIASLANEQGRKKGLILQKYSPLALMSSLHQHAEKLEEDSENQLENLMSRQISAEEFMENFMKSRKEYHSTKLSASRLPTRF